MRISFTKMQGAGNDFVVLDETQGQFGLSTNQYRWLADRRFGVGADQILSVRPSSAAGIDFEYLIHNADGGEVGQCGNGARCFMRFVHERGLTQAKVLRVQTQSGVISPRLGSDGTISVDMGLPRFEPAQVPFDTQGLTPEWHNGFPLWPLALDGQATPVWVGVVSMGNPHAVIRVPDVDSAPVHQLGPQLQAHTRFGAGVNVGFMQVLNRAQLRLRVYERGAGETLACGSGACAATVVGMRTGLLDSPAQVQARGGRLDIAWAADALAPVWMSGPAQTVFHGEIDIPDPAPAPI